MRPECLGRAGDFEVRITALNEDMKTFLLEFCDLCYHIARSQSAGPSLGEDSSRERWLISGVAGERLDFLIDGIMK